MTTPSRATLHLLAERRPQLAPIVTVVEGLLDGADEQALYRINPHSLAAEHGLKPASVVEVMLHATHAGLFQLSWSLLCRGCGSVVESFRSLSCLNDHFFCADCDRERASVLDDNIIVAFTVHPSVRGIRFHEPLSLGLDDYFYATYFGSDILLRDTGESFEDFLRERESFKVIVAAGGELVVDAALSNGDMVGSPRHRVTIGGPAVEGTQSLMLSFHDGVFEPHGLTTGAGAARLTLVNPTDTDLRVFSYISERIPYFAYRPFLSGKDLLNNRTFRSLFKDQLIEISSGVAVRDVTLLFTDLRDSTAFYAAVGDARAFELIKGHFQAIGDVIGVHGGVIIKTMGDAVMAAFSSPADGVRAALASIRATAQFSAGEGISFEIKAGLHRGPSIAVSLNNNADYFGQTANIAARIQGCAGPSEICMSEDVYGDEDVIKVLRGYGRLPVEEITLRGLDGPTHVRRLKTTNNG